MTMNQLKKNELEVFEKSLDDMYLIAQSLTESSIKVKEYPKESDIIKEYRYGYELYVWHLKNGLTFVLNECSGAKYIFKNRDEAHNFAKAHASRYRMMR